MLLTEYDIKNCYLIRLSYIVRIYPLTRFVKAFGNQSKLGANRFPTYGFSSAHNVHHSLIMFAAKIVKKGRVTTP